MFQCRNFCMHMCFCTNCMDCISRYMCLDIQDCVYVCVCVSVCVCVCVWVCWRVCGGLWCFFFFFVSLGLADRFEEYPKLRELIRLKDELISTTNTPPM